MDTAAVEVRPLGGHRLHVRFADATEGEVDLSRHMDFNGVFEPLRDPMFFQQVRVDEFGGIYWPNEADICPDVLYSYVTGLPIEQIVPGAKSERVR